MFKRSKERKSNRSKGYNYSQNGWYFVTVCTAVQKSYFGRMKSEKIILNKYGQIIQDRWLWLQKQYNYVRVDEYIIMPNHIHGILIIDFCDSRDNSRLVPTKAKKIKTLSELIGAFKTTSSELIRQNRLLNFKWHRSFYDHIIRSEKSLTNVRNYIQSNPLKWDLDENNLKNKKIQI